MGSFGGGQDLFAAGLIFKQGWPQNMVDLKTEMFKKSRIQSVL